MISDKDCTPSLLLDTVAYEGRPIARAELGWEAEEDKEDGDDEEEEEEEEEEEVEEEVEKGSKEPISFIPSSL